MAFFKFRWPGRGEQDDGRQQDARRSGRSRHATPPPAESAETLRRRARHRLIGAAVLLVVGVVGFPVLFDTQPRPIPVDIPIAIPDRNQAPALVMPGARASGGTVEAGSTAPAASATTSAPAAATAVVPAASVAAPTTAQRGANANGLDDNEEVVASSLPRKPAEEPAARKEPAARNEPAKPAAETAKPAEPRREARTESKPETRPEPKPERPAALRVDEAARARALLEGRSDLAVAAAPAAASTAAAAAEGRFVVQVGAFGDADKAQEARGKLSRGGLKTYVQTVETKDGKRHRVRVGPFMSRAEADKAAARIRGLDLPASILSL